MELTHDDQESSLFGGGAKWHMEVSGEWMQTTD
jgi:hypothetical protein